MYAQLSCERVTQVACTAMLAVTMWTGALQGLGVPSAMLAVTMWTGALQGLGVPSHTVMVLVVRHCMRTTAYSCGGDSLLSDSLGSISMMV